jgi:serine protease Do
VLAAAQSQPDSGQSPPTIDPQARAVDLVSPAMAWVRVQYNARVTTHLSPEPVRVVLDVGCSGFIVNPDGYVVTAGHCVQDGMDGAQGAAIERVVDQLVAAGTVSSDQHDSLINEVMVGNVRWRVEGELANSRPDHKVSVAAGGGNVKLSSKMIANNAAPARLVQFLGSDQGDVALLKIDKTGLSSILLSPGDDIEVGEELVSVGYTASDSLDGETLALISRNGKINAQRSKGPNSRSYYETSAALTSGMSGGPTVNLDGQVVGLASCKAQDAKFIVPSSVIQELLSRSGAHNEFGRVDRLYRQGSRAITAAPTARPSRVSTRSWRSGQGTGRRWRRSRRPPGCVSTLGTRSRHHRRPSTAPTNRLLEITARRWLPLPRPPG